MRGLPYWIGAALWGLYAFHLLVTPDGANGDTCHTSKASYYERCFGTCASANGEHFNPDGVTAAHRTLRFGTKVRVTNKLNGRKVTVRINDRGPYAGDGRGHRPHPTRNLDLSRGAMRKLGGLNAGVIPITYCY
jgi:rare lipoprotein A